jgi:hypothetical protein
MRVMRTNKRSNEDENDPEHEADFAVAYKKLAKKLQFDSQASALVPLTDIKRLENEPKININEF